MELKNISLCIVLSLLCSFVQADEASHRAEAEKLLLTINIDKMMEPIWAQMDSMMQQQFSQIENSNKSKPIFDKYRNQLNQLIKNELSWTKMKDDYIDIYVSTYTEKEIKQISEFYASPIGQKFIEKMPQLMQESMAISQKKMPILMESLQKISEEMSNELRQLKK